MSVIVQTPWRHRRKVLTAEPYNEGKQDSIHAWIQSILSGVQRFDMVVLGFLVIIVYRGEMGSVPI